MSHPEPHPTHPFRPLTGLSNPHFQTVIGSLWKGPRFHTSSTPHRVVLDDGDALAILQTPPRPDENRWVLLVHGMGGAARSAYIQRLARRFAQMGWGIIRVDLRGSGDGVRLARGIYNAGVSHDIRAVVRQHIQKHPNARVVAIGFSLGGNIVLKLAGEAGTDPLPGLAGVVAVAPPIDLRACSAAISEPRNRFYDRKFVRDLIQLAADHHHHHPDIPLPALRLSMTVRDFDEVYTAPRGRFRDANDYYERSSSAPLITRINVPTWILTAADDPFIAVEPFRALQLPARTSMTITPHGGHLGFLGADGIGGHRWAEQQIVVWAKRTITPHAD